MPRHVLRAAGAGLDFDRLREAVEAAGEGKFALAELRRGHDPRLRGSFGAAPDSRPYADEHRAATGDAHAPATREPAAHDSGAEPVTHGPGTHESVVYVLSAPVSPATAWDISRRALAVTAALLTAGATAVRNEAGGVTWGRAQWLELAAAAGSGTADVFELATALRQAWVTPVLEDDGVLHSRGMHLLGEADVELAPERPIEPESLEGWADTMGALAYYLLSSQPGRRVHDGDGFRIRPGATRWVLRKVACERYGEDSFAFNPYGYWRLVRG
ncbi:hypothetical protein [Streptomyces sp. NPDC004284]|uniref:hypothetical protein n=1 Tax=Streptomyces sp. NPDC004284 TaxID=3364695 RepID=UPI00367D2A17